jgi:hypothetical protein
MVSKIGIEVEFPTAPHISKPRSYLPSHIAMIVRILRILLFSFIALPADGDDCCLLFRLYAASGWRCYEMNMQDHMAYSLNKWQ